MRKAFTLIELLVVVALLAILMVVVVIKINPIQLLYESQDAQREAGVQTINKAVSLYYEDSIGNPQNLYMGSSSVVYVSIPDSLATSSAGDQCQGLGLPAFSTTTSYTYHCATASNLRNTNGTGWVPINFDSFSGGKIISTLPVDPSNSTSTGTYFTYVTDGVNYTVTANMQSTKYAANGQSDSGAYPGLFEAGTKATLLPSNYGSHFIYVVDKGDNRVEKFTTSGTYVSQFGSYGSGNGQFSGPGAIAVDSSGNIYVADGSNNRIEKFDANGNYLTQFGSYGSGNGQFSGPNGIFIDSSGNIYVTDMFDDRVEKFDANGNYLLQFGSAGTGSGQFIYPGAIAVDGSGNIYVTDENNYRVEKFDANGNYLTQFGTSGTGQLEGALDLAMDGKGNIYIPDTGNSRIVKFDTNGDYLAQFPVSGQPFNVAVDGSGNMYATTNAAAGILKYDQNGNYLSSIGSGGTGNGQFTTPEYMATY